MWLLYAVSAVVCTTTLALLFRTISQRSHSSRAFAFVFNTTALIISVFLVSINGIGVIVLNEYLYVLLIISGIGYGIFQRYQFSVRKNIEASVLQTIATPASIAGYVLAVIWLGESVTIQKIIGYSCILLAGLVVIRPKKTNFIVNKYFIVTILITMSLSIAGTIDRRVAPQFSSALTYTLVIWLFQSFAVAVPRLSIKAIREEASLHSWRIPVLAAINILALYFTISALKIAPVSQVSPVLACNVVFIALFGIIFLKERDYVLHKLVAALITFVGLFFISR